MYEELQCVQILSAARVQPEFTWQNSGLFNSCRNYTSWYQAGNSRDMCIKLFIRQVDTTVKVMATHVCLAITVTWFIQPMPILTLACLKVVPGSTYSDLPTFWSINFLQRNGYVVSWPLPHIVLKSESIPQAFSAMCRIVPSVSQCG